MSYEERCPRCDGDGMIDMGTGYSASAVDSGDLVSIECPRCHGTGWVPVAHEMAASTRIQPQQEEDR